jgi:Complex I intermediate-associated protein 30 (CIA30)
MPLLYTLRRLLRLHMGLHSYNSKPHHSAFAVDLYPDPKVLYSFKSEKDVKQWRLFTDAAFGGLSTAGFALSPETQEVGPESKPAMAGKAKLHKQAPVPLKTGYRDNTAALLLSHQANDCMAAPCICRLLSSAGDTRRT